MHEPQAKPTFYLDGICFDQEQATNLFVHYVKMATKLFEIVPDDENKFVGSKIFIAFEDKDSREIAMRFADDLLRYHNELKVRLGD